MVSNLRYVTGRHPGDAGLAALIGELSIGSPEFAVLWADHRVHPCEGDVYELGHLVVGPLTVTQQNLSLPRSPGQSLVLVTAAADSASQHALTLLAQARRRHPAASPAPGRPQLAAGRAGDRVEGDALVGEVGEVGQRQCGAPGQRAVVGQRRDPLLAEQVRAPQPGLGQRPAQQRGVGLARGEASAAVVDAQQFQRRVGVGLAPAAEQRRGEGAQRRPGVPEPQRPGAQAARVQGRVHGGQRGDGPGPKGVAGVGEAQVVRGAVGEPHAEVGFELAQGAGQGGLGEVEPGRGAGQVGLVGVGEEVAQMTQLHGHDRQA